MKNQTDNRPAHPRRTDKPPRRARRKEGQDGLHPNPPGDGGQPPDPIAHHARERRLYTDFLALAFYPGMTPTTPARRATRAA